MVGWFTDDPLYLQPGQKCLLAARRWFHAEPDPGSLHQAGPPRWTGRRPSELAQTLFCHLSFWPHPARATSRRPDKQEPWSLRRERD